MAQASSQPGTVSKILWHFTGGPKWDAKTDRQSLLRKPAASAYSAFCGILQSKELRLGGYAELARVLLPERTRYDEKTRKTIVRKAVKVTVKSSPVCCLADIPIAHLQYHESRYGKFAIGYHRSAAVQHGFNPVLYTLENTEIIRALYRGLAELDTIDFSSASAAANEVGSYFGDCEHDDIDDLRMYGDEAAAYIDDIESSVNYAQERFAQLLAFTKTFSQDGFSSIYCEREWRSLKPFQFTFDDIAMLILPHRIGKRNYYTDFIRNEIRRLNLPRRVPVVPWEDLIEH